MNDFDARLRSALGDLAAEAETPQHLDDHVRRRIEVRRRRRLAITVGAAIAAVVVVVAAVAGILGSRADRVTPADEPQQDGPPATVDPAPDADELGIAVTTDSRRPDQRYFDVELDAGESLALLSSDDIVDAVGGDEDAEPEPSVGVALSGGQLVGADDLPLGLVPTTPAPAGVVPVVEGGAGPFLRVDLEASEWPIVCSATSWEDGAVALPLQAADTPLRAGLYRSQVPGSSESSPRDRFELEALAPPVTGPPPAQLWFPTGGRTGTFSVACTTEPLLVLLQPVVATVPAASLRGVWSFDV